MSDLVEWLTSILDEDEARISSPVFCGGPWPSADQMLADIAAKRAILGWCTERAQVYVGRIGGDRSDPANYVPGQPLHGSDSVVARLLAAAYADRPGYREEWRP